MSPIVNEWYANTIADEWRGFADKVIANNAPAVQRSEMESAFYAGAYAIICLFRRTPEDISDEDGVAMIEGWERECLAFKDAYAAKQTGSQR